MCTLRTFLTCWVHFDTDFKQIDALTKMLNVVPYTGKILTYAMTMGGSVLYPMLKLDSL